MVRHYNAQHGSDQFGRGMSVFALVESFSMCAEDVFSHEDIDHRRGHTLNEKSGVSGADV